MHSREEQLNGVTALVDWLYEAELQLPYFLTGNHSVYVKDADELMATRKALGGRVEKVFNDSGAGFRKEFGGGVQLTVLVARDQVCERKQVGEEVVPAQAEYVRPIYEWVCPDSLLNKVSNA